MSVSQTYHCFWPRGSLYIALSSCHTVEILLYPIKIEYSFNINLKLQNYPSPTSANHTPLIVFRSRCFPAKNVSSGWSWNNSPQVHILLWTCSQGSALYSCHLSPSMFASFYWAYKFYWEKWLFLGGFCRSFGTGWWCWFYGTLRFEATRSLFDPPDVFWLWKADW